MAARTGTRARCRCLPVRVSVPLENFEKRVPTRDMFVVDFYNYGNIATKTELEEYLVGKI